MGKLNLLYSFPTDDGAISGGSWLAGLPAANLQTLQPSKLARSSDALTTSTRFVIDLGRLAPVSMFVIVNHNFSAASTVRFRLSENADGSSPSIDATVDGYPTSVVWGSTPWGAFPWDGRATTSPPGGFSTFYKHSSTQTGRYVLVDITDTGNLDGYVQAGRFLAGEAFEPRRNLTWGAQLGFVDEAKQSRSVGGQLYSDPKPRRRRLSGNLKWLSHAEGMGAIYDLQQVAGITGGMFVVYDPTDEAEVLTRRSFYGSLVALDPISHDRPGGEGTDETRAPYSWNFAIEELL